jgi:hypothetical protein
MMHHDYIMVRTQIQLTAGQHRQLKRLAQQRGISLSVAIRRLVADCLDAEKNAPTRAAMVRDALQVVGAYRDPAGATTVGEEHDRYLAEAHRK